MDLFNKFGEFLADMQRGEINDLMKSDGNELPQNPMSPHNEKTDLKGKAIIDDPYFDNTSQHMIFKHKASRLTNKTLKDVSLRDWLVSAIIQNRVDTLQWFSRPQRKKFEKGFRFIKKNEKEDYTDEDNTNIANLEDWLYNCGRTDNLSPADTMLFGKFLKMIIRDALTVGYVSIEKVGTRAGALHHLKPIPAEQTYLIDKKSNKKLVEDTIRGARLANAPRSDNDPEKDKTFNEIELAYYKYAQVGIDNRVLAVFGDEDMIFRTFNPQNFGDTLGYDYGPLELAIINITNHLNAENYNANFFTHGYAARGVLHLKGSVTQSQLTMFRRQFYNTINGTQNAWRTPIISGLDEVQWIPMSGNARDMEYINFNNHLMRAICTQFQIDPIELGMDFLTSSTGRTAGNQQSNRQKVEYSRERGLYPIIMFIEDLVNKDILPLIDTKLAEKYTFRFEGYTDETPQTEVALLQAEMTVNKSMNDLLRAARKEKIDHLVADLPMNQAFWAVVEKNMTKGEIREFLFKDKGAAERKELSYFPADPAFLQWANFLFTLNNTKKQEEMQNHQMQMQQSEDQRNQEAHDMSKDTAANQGAAAAVSASQGQSPQDIAKSVGATKSVNVGGTNIKNPINL